nr:hypothetical protein [Tanacetum cinerariifolium]
TTVPIPPFAPRPLCNFQLALANQACAYLPSSRIPPSPPSPFAPVHLNPPPPPVRPQIHSHSHGHGHGHSHNHRHQHDHDELGTNLGDNETHVPEHGHNHPRHEHHKHLAFICSIRFARLGKRQKGLFLLNWNLDYGAIDVTVVVE